MRIRVHTTSRSRYTHTYVSLLGDSRCKIRSDIRVDGHFAVISDSETNKRAAIDRSIDRDSLYSRQSAVNARLSVSSLNVPVEIPGNATCIFAHFKRPVVVHLNNFTSSFFHTVRIVNHDF